MAQIITQNGGGGGGGGEKYVAGQDIAISGGLQSDSGSMSISVSDAISLEGVIAYGGASQNGTPTPTSPVDIECNNGVLKFDGNLYADGTQETISDGTNVANAEILLSVSSNRDEQNLITGKITRNVKVLVLDGTEDWTKNGTHFEAELLDNNAFSHLICTHFKNEPVALNDLAIYKSSGSPILQIRYDAQADVDAFKSWLASEYANNTPVMVLYALEIPTEETVAGQTLALTDGAGTFTITASQISPLNIGVSYRIPGNIIDFTNETGYITKADVPTKVSELENDAGYVDSSALSGYQTVGNMVCSLTCADNTHYPTAKAVADAITSAGGGDMLKSVYDPNNCETDAFNYNNMYNKLTAGSGINITANAISTASNFGTSSTAAATAQKEVSIPGITTLVTGQVVHILPSVTSTVANSTLKVNNFDAYPMRYNNAAITTSTDSIVRPANIVTSFVFDGTYWQFIGHGLDSNTTYSNMSVAEATTGTCASGRSIAACTLKCAINTFAPISSSAYGSGWCGSTSAPTQDAVYAKVSTIDELIPSAATCSNQLADKNYVNDSINSVTAYYITKNAAGDQFATYAELAAATTFYSGGVVRVPTRNDYTIVLDDETHDDEVTRYIYNSGWEYQYTINESPLTQAQLDALNSGITAAKVSAYDAIPTITDNCQIANGCGYTTCTGTISTCSQIISTLGYTPYNSTNPSGYTTCTGTLTSANISDTAFGVSWDGDTTTAPSKNAVYDVLGDVETLLANL